MTTRTNTGRRRPLSARPLTAAIAAAMLLPACSSATSASHEGEHVAASRAAQASAPSYDQVHSALAAFMATPNVYPLEASNPTIGVPGHELFGSEGPQRWVNGDQAQAWHDANTVTMLADFQIMGLGHGLGSDNLSQSIVEDYLHESYDVLNPFSGYGCGLSGGLNLNNCGNPNPFNDDDLWWALAYLRANGMERVSGGSLGGQFVSGAERAFQHVCAQWASVPETCGGGVPQQASFGPQPNGLGVITNSLLFETAMQLYFADPGATNVCSGAVPWTTATTAPAAGAGPEGMTHQFANTYLGWALAEYEFFKQNWWSRGNFPMADGLDGSCNLAGPAYTYNQGPILGALLELSNAGYWVPGGLAGQGEADSRDTVLDYGFRIATATMADVNVGGMSENGILTEAFGSDQQCFDQNSGNGDCPEFKGIFMRYLARFASQAAPKWGEFAHFSANAVNFLNTNAAAIYAAADPAGPYLPEDWGAKSFSRGSIGPMWQFQTTETSGMDALIAPLIVSIQGTPPPPLPPGPGCTFQMRCDGLTSFACSMDDPTNPDSVAVYQRTASGDVLVSYANSPNAQGLNSWTSQFQGTINTAGATSGTFYGCTLGRGTPICDQPTTAVLGYCAPPPPPPPPCTTPESCCKLGGGRWINNECISSCGTPAQCCVAGGGQWHLGKCI